MKFIQQINKDLNFKFNFKQTQNNLTKNDHVKLNKKHINTNFIENNNDKINEFHAVNKSNHNKQQNKNMNFQISNELI